MAGEVNFSYSRFQHKQEGLDQPSFDRAQFAGVAFFHRTIFENGVSMEEMRFEAGVRFEGSGSDICVAKEVLTSAKVPDDLISQMDSKQHRILSLNKDHDDHYNFNWNIRSEDNLKERLSKISPQTELAVKAVSCGQALQEDQNITGNAVESVLEIWRNGSQSSMFNGCTTFTDEPMHSSFKKTQFCNRSSFSHLDLGVCLFQGANVADIHFTVVEWARRPCGLVMRKFFRDFKHHPELLLTDRAALRDEFVLDDDEADVKSHDELRKRRQELSELYRKLRIAYDREGDTQTGRDFYFGEVEAERMSYQGWRKYLGIANLYRIFSGYSKREGLAFSWLVSAMLLIFPLCFWLSIGIPEHRKLLIPYPQIQDTASGQNQACRLFPYYDGLINTEAGPEKSMQAASAQKEQYDMVMKKAIASAWGNGTLSSIFLRPLISSLEASTFLAPPTGNNALSAAIQMLGSVRCGTPALQQTYANAADALSGLEGHKRALQALERLLVPAQLGLFLLALRSKFQRTR